METEKTPKRGKKISLMLLSLFLVGIKHTSQLDWGLWWLKAVITTQAAIAARNFGPWIGGAITTIAYIASERLGKVLKHYAGSIKSHRHSRSTIAKWAASRAMNQIF